VLANLLPEEFLPIRRRVLARVTPEGRAILSGISRDREDEVLGRVRSERWRLAGRRSENEWTSLTLERA
jgi:ribosomal protein L11 methylase PrmA